MSLLPHEAEVREKDVVLLTDQNVLHFQVPVDPLLGVQEHQGLDQLLAPNASLTLGDLLFRRGFDLFQDIGLRELHEDEAEVADRVIDDLVHVDDVSVLQGASRFNLTGKELVPITGRFCLEVDDFAGDGRRLLVTSHGDFVNSGKASISDLVFELESPLLQTFRRFLGPGSLVQESR